MSATRNPDRRTRTLLTALLVLGAALAGCTAPPPPTESPPLFAQTWGSYGAQDGEFNVLTGVAVDAAGDVYTTDSANNRVQKFSDAGVHLASWGSHGTADGQMKYPSGVAVDAAGNVYVIDSGNRRIQKFTSNGAFLAKWGSFGSGNGQFIMPRGIAVDAQGSVFVSDAMGDRVQKFTSNGAFLAKWGSFGSGDGQFKYARGVAVDAAGFVYVADYSNHRVQVFTNDGTFVTKWGAHGTGEGELSAPYGVAVDHAGGVYVTEVHNHRVQKFGAFGAFLSAWGGHGHNPGEFHEPFGVAVDTAKNVFVVDGGHHRLQKFRYVPDAVEVSVLLDGVPWAGPIGYVVAGPQTLTGTTAPHVATPVAPGAYTVTYLSGGPPGAFYLNTTVVGPKTLAPGGAVTFTLNFTAPTAVHAQATLNGAPWTGALNYTVTRTDPAAMWSIFSGGGTSTSAGVAVPTLHNVTPGTFMATIPGVGTGPMLMVSVGYVSGGPAGATYTGKTVTGAGWLMTHMTKTATFHFRTDGLTPDSLVVNATLNGAPWSGPVGWQVDLFAFPPPPGSSFVGGTVPHVLAHVPQTNFTLTDPTTGGTGPGSIYVIQHVSGGPPGATLAGISPDHWTVLHHNGTKTFTLNFEGPAGGAQVDATLDGQPWAGPVAYTLTGPQTVGGASAPQAHAGLSPGAYTLGSVSGGPANATLISVTPAATQSVTVGGVTHYTLHFRSRPAQSTLAVDATLDGAPWTGAVSYTLTGPQTITGAAAPQTWMGAAGAYTLAYVSGGPPGASFTGVAPAPTQSVAGGGTAAFTLGFATKKAETGVVVVEATTAGAGGAAPWTGPLNFTLTGPQTLLGSSVGQNFANAPAGAYTLTYVSGGPPGMALQSITPATNQTLAPGGSVTFRMNFR